LMQASALAEISNVRLVVVREHVVAEDGQGNLRRLNQVDLKQTSLQLTILLSVVLQYIKQQRGGLLNHVSVHEEVDNLLKE